MSHKSSSILRKVPPGKNKKAGPENPSDPRSPYRLFALIYDRVMDHVPYEEWAEYLKGIAGRHFGSLPDSILDLGCGTGRMLYQMGEVRNRTGLDLSVEMLSIARERFSGIRFLEGDFQKKLPFESSSLDWVICTHDSLNYILDIGLLEKHFAEVRRILRSGGLYSFDVVTLGNILDNYDTQTIRKTYDDLEMLWTNAYDTENEILDSELTFKKNGRLIMRETHLQRYYTPGQIRRAALSHGFKIIKEHGDYSRRKPGKTDSLWNFHATAV